jgi:AAA domain
MSVASLATTTITPYRLLTDIEIENLPPPEWLIDALIPRNALVVLYGEPGIGKTFLALDWAMSVAAGRTWLGRTVQQGHVLYLAFEGSAGFGPRLRAWKLNCRSAVGQSFPISFLADAPALTQGESPRVAHTIATMPICPVFDTFVRALDGSYRRILVMA